MLGRYSNIRGTTLRQAATARKLKQAVKPGLITRRDVRGGRDLILDLIFYSESIDFVKYTIGRDND